MLGTNPLSSARSPYPRAPQEVPKHTLWNSQPADRLARGRVPDRLAQGRRREGGNCCLTSVLRWTTHAPASDLSRLPLQPIHASIPSRTNESAYPVRCRITVLDIGAGTELVRRIRKMVEAAAGLLWVVDPRTWRVCLLAAATRLWSSSA
jgi:hypothetical protein